MLKTVHSVLLAAITTALVLGWSALAGNRDVPSVPARTLSPPDIVGLAEVIDGDTIEIAGERIRLEGIDAPEQGQTCPRRWAGTWACGREATKALMAMAEGREVGCVGRSIDRYGRRLATCFADGLDVNAQMVRMGMAWAFVRYSAAYVGEETEARRAGRGIWQAPAMPAWDFRAQQWARAGTVQRRSDDCLIKGNVSNNGRVYHMPWSPWYDRIVMDGAGGKRWFCDEAEATAAGWRPASGS